MLSKADFAGEVFAHKDLKGSNLSVFHMGRPSKIGNGSKIDDDWDTDVVIIGSPGGLTTNTRVYSVSLKDISKPSTELGSEDSV